MFLFLTILDDINQFVGMVVQQFNIEFEQGRFSSKTRSRQDSTQTQNNILVKGFFFLKQS